MSHCIPGLIDDYKDSESYPKIPSNTPIKDQLDSPPALRRPSIGIVGARFAGPGMAAE